MSDEINNFFLCNKEKLDDPLIRNFLKESSNYNLLLTALQEPSHENQANLDQAFKKHYKEVKIISYISKLIHFFAIDYDKKVNLYYERNILSIDSQPDSIGFYEGEKSDDKFYWEGYEFKGELLDLVTTKSLFNALKKLPNKQIAILDLKYNKDLNNKEIARVLKESEQSISYHHKKSLRRLKELIQVD